MAPKFSVTTTTVQILYVDQQFPPNDSSLGRSLAASGLLTWCRPSNLGINVPYCGAGGTTAVVASTATSAFGGYGRPLPSDVRACPFAMDASLPCALAALAERPRLVSHALCGRVEEMVAIAASASSGSGGSSGGRDGGCDRGGGGGSRSFLDKSGRPCRRSDGGIVKGRRRVLRSKKAKAGSALTATEMAAKASTSAAQWGMFSARLCVDGVWKEYIMDDYFPCIATPRGSGPRTCSGSGGLCLSRAHGRALWVSMLEKAYARATGSYSAALRGVCLFSEEEESKLDVSEGGEAGAWAGPKAGTARIAASVIARPAEVLGVFTGAPVLQVEILRGRRRTGWGGVAEEEKADYDGHEAEQAAGELWGNVVSRLGVFVYKICSPLLRTK